MKQSTLSFKTDHYHLCVLQHSLLGVGDENVYLSECPNDKKPILMLGFTCLLRLSLTRWGAWWWTRGRWQKGGEASNEERQRWEESCDVQLLVLSFLDDACRALLHDAADQLGRVSRQYLHIMYYITTVYSILYKTSMLSVDFNTNIFVNMHFLEVNVLIIILLRDNLQDNGASTCSYVLKCYIVSDASISPHTHTQSRQC